MYKLISRLGELRSLYSIVFPRSLRAPAATADKERVVVASIRSESLWVLVVNETNVGAHCKRLCRQSSVETQLRVINTVINGYKVEGPKEHAHRCT